MTSRFFEYYLYEFQNSEHFMSLFPNPYFDFEKKCLPVLFPNPKIKIPLRTRTLAVFEKIPNILRTRTLIPIFLRTRTVYEFRTLVRVHKHYGFRTRTSGYG